MLELIPAFPTFIPPRNKTCVDPNKTWVRKPQSSLFRFQEKQGTNFIKFKKKELLHQSPNIQDSFIFKGAIGNVLAFPFLNTQHHITWWRVKLGIPNEVTASASSDFSKASWKPTERNATHRPATNSGAFRQLREVTNGWASTSCVSNEMRPGKAGCKKVLAEILTLISTLRFSLYAENKKKQKLPCHVSTCYLSWVYSELSTCGKSVTCPDFQCTVHKRSLTIRHRYAFDFSVWSGRHVDLEIRRNHSASVKPPISRGATLARLFNKKYAKTCAKIMPKLGIKPMEKRRKTMENKRKRMEKRRKKTMEKKKKTQMRFYPSPQQKTPKCGIPHQTPPPKVSQALGTYLVWRPSQTRPPVEADVLKNEIENGWAMKKKPASIWERITQSTFFDIFFAHLWNWCSNTSRYGRRFQRHIAHPSSWRTIYHTDLERCWE